MKSCLLILSMALIFGCSKATDTNVATSSGQSASQSDETFDAGDWKLPNNSISLGLQFLLKKVSREISQSPSSPRFRVRPRFFTPRAQQAIRPPDFGLETYHRVVGG